MASAKLVDNLTGQEYLISSRVITIGRKEDNDIVVRNRVVSKYHIEIRKRLVGYTISDAGSTHGIYLNNERLPKHAKVRLRDGDRIRVLIIYPDDMEMPKPGKGSSTIATRPSAVFKKHLDGKEKNVNLGCDFTFRLEGGGFLTRLLGGSRGEESGEE